MKFVLTCLFIAAAAGYSQSAVAQETAATTAGPSATNPSATHQEMVDRSIRFLREKGQAEDGSFSGKSEIGPTGLVVTALLASGVKSEDPMVAKGLKYLESYIQPSGGIHKPESLHRNYATCIAMMAFAKANESGRYDGVLARAEAFVKGIQWDASEGKSEDDPFWGGAGYGSHSRPDMSNTSYLIDALRELGRGSEDKSMQQALAFISRCQNIESEHNKSEFADKIGDGGFYYTVAAGGESKAGVEDNGGLRSYGSMTYAGLKSMIYAGVSQDDRRVKAAITFLQKNYDLESNPGMGQQGLYYYYHTMAKAFDAIGQKHFVDADGKKHEWKSEIRSKLADVQRPDGSWVNDTTRWMEGDPNLVCGYAMLALSYCKPDAK